MSSKYKENDKKPIVLNNDNTKGKNTLTAMTAVLASSSQQLRNKWCEQLLYKLYIIHNEFENTVYNICLKNLKVDKNNNLVLINVFGSQKNNLEVPDNIKTKLDIKFVAPELIENNEKTESGDIWAAGICIYYINNSTFPWETANESDKNFKSWSNKGVFPKSIENPFTRALKQMLCVAPETRPNIKKVIRLALDTGTDKNFIGKLYSLNILIKMQLNLNF